MSQTRYQILGTIGVGASSRVDKARDTLIDRTVVLKTFANGFGTPDLQKQFLREAQILGRLSHPNIISIYDLGTNDDGSAYLVTEYVPGKTLEAVLAEKGPIPLARAGVWAGDLANALSRAHKAGVIHGDVKPANIFVTEEGQIKLGDFGIARFATQVSGSASLVGTPAYLSPEQIKGETQDHRSDIFSIGIVLYQLTTGVRPFDGTSIAAVCAQIVAKNPAVPSHYNPELPPEFDRIVMRCLAKNPGERYASGESLAASLYPFARSKPVQPPHRLDFSWFQGPLRPAEGWIFGAAVVAALAAIPVAYHFYRAQHEPAVAKTNAQNSTAASVAGVSLPSADFAPPPSESGARKALPSKMQTASRQASAAQPGISKTAPDADRVGPVEPMHRPFRAEGKMNSVPGKTASSSAQVLGKPATPGSHTVTAAPTRAASGTSLGIEISSAIDGGTLAIFVDRQLLATSPLSVTRPGESLHLDRPLPPGPHEFRLALYRQDKTLQTEKQGLAELEAGASNMLSVHVVRRAKMLLKHNADLEVLWPSAYPPDSGGQRSAKPSTPLVATSVPASR